MKKDPMLTATIIKNSIGHVPDSRAKGVVAAIERGVALHSALHTLRTTDDPNTSKESLALQYKRKADKVRDEFNGHAATQTETLVNWRQEVTRRAEAAAGFHKPLAEAHAAEIRAAIRNMPQADRDAALVEAAKRGDTNVIQAVRNSPSPILTGPVTGQLDALVDSMMKQADPNYEHDLEVIDTGLNQLNSFHKRFSKAVEEMRMPAAEARGEQQEQIVGAAKSVIG